MQRTLCDRIRQGRRRRGLTQQRLADALGVAASAVAQWEAAAGTQPTTHHLLSLAAALRVPFEWLATGRGPTALGPDESPALDPAGIAQDAIEEEALAILRRLSPRRRQAAVRLLDELVGRRGRETGR